MEFQAKRSGANAIVTWKTGSESGIDRYEIEVAKGDDALSRGDFLKIGEVTVSGNSVSEKQYSFTDTEPNKTGIRYYRLKIVSTDGTFRYSTIAPVVFDELSTWQLYPNPSDGLFNLVFRLNFQEMMTGMIYDANGKLVKTISGTGTGQIQKTEIDLRGMAAGVYLLRVQTPNGKQSFKLYKK